MKFVKRIKPLPKWTMYRYAKLFSRFKSEEFTYDDILKTLHEDHNMVSVTLSHLKKNGWVNIKLDPDDSRKRLYQLLNPEKAVTVIGNE